MTPAPTRLEPALERLERWLESVRGPDGYGGPVVHWWRDCLLFCGAGLDWRYEGIIAGYLALHERTGGEAWLAKALRAGEDLVRGQLPGGNYRHSRFELNPGTAGTPHEAAADVGLLLLARTLRERGDENWDTYFQTAERNLQDFSLARLWSQGERRFRDDPATPTFVPNKCATLIEALCRYAELSGSAEVLERYVRPSADAILSLQLGPGAGRLDGGIAQHAAGRRVVEKYFLYYNARCVPGLLDAYHALDDPRYRQAALAAMRFVLRWRDPDGGLPQVVYCDGRVNRYPRWVAALGDVLRAAELLRPYGLESDLATTRGFFLAGQLPSGAIAPARGFAAQVGQQTPIGPPDARDLLPVAGWGDKAFRYLAGYPGAEPPPTPTAHRLPCRFEGQLAWLEEDDEQVQIGTASGLRYRWVKTGEWAESWD